MDSLRTRCPDDMVLEAFVYNDLPMLRRLWVRSHLLVCRACRHRIEDLRSFSNALSGTAFEEPPAGFAFDLVKAVDSWGVPTPAAAVDESDQAASVHGPALRWRWAAGALMFLASSFLQWKLGDYLPQYLSGSYLSGLKGLQSLWDSIVSGALWQSIVLVIAAIRTDGLSALEIMGATIPTQIAGVVVFGGIVTAVFVSQMRASRRRGEGHR